MSAIPFCQTRIRANLNSANCAQELIDIGAESTRDYALNLPVHYALLTGGDDGLECVRVLASGNAVGEQAASLSLASPEMVSLGEGEGGRSLEGRLGWAQPLKVVPGVSFCRLYRLVREIFSKHMRAGTCVHSLARYHNALHLAVVSGAGQRRGCQASFSGWCFSRSEDFKHFRAQDNAALL